MKYLIALLIAFTFSPVTVQADTTRNLFQVVIDNGQTALDAEEKLEYKRPFFRYVYSQFPSSRKDSVYLFSTFTADNIFFDSPAGLKKREDLVESIDNLDHVRASDGKSFENLVNSDLIAVMSRIKSNEANFTNIEKESIIYMYSPFLHSSGLKGDTTDKAVLNRTIQILDSLPILDPEIAPQRKTVMFWVDSDIVSHVRDLWKEKGYGQLEIYTDVQAKSILQKYKN